MIFIASSWKQRERVRKLAADLREQGYDVYDFSDPSCRSVPEIPPEKYPEQFDPGRHQYWEYLNDNPEWREAMEENRRNIDRCVTLVLLLPCGIDATADWAYAIGKGKKTYVVGHPNSGERSPVHLWADGWFPTDEACLSWLTT